MDCLVSIENEKDIDNMLLKENTTTDISSKEIICKECTLVGSLTGPRPVIKDMIKVCVEKNIYPIVEEYPFEDLPKAFDKLENGKPHFRCVVNAKDYAENHGLKK